MLFHKPTNLGLSKCGLFNTVIKGIIIHNGPVKAPQNQLYYLMMFLYGYKSFEQCQEAIRSSCLPF